MAAHTPVCGRANILDVVDPGEIYLTFVFDGIDSTTAGVSSVTNSGTYDTPILPTYNDNSLDVDGYDGKYYFNTRLTEKNFSYYCFIDNLSANQYEQLKAWLHPKKIGKLIRPEEPYKYYWVKVSSIDNLQNIPLTHPDTGGVSYTGFFNVTFTTLGQACSYLADGLIYQGDIPYYEYRDIYPENTNIQGDYFGYYDTGMLYREECLPMNFTYATGNYTLEIYNPGTYPTKLKLVLVPKSDINVPSGGNEEDYFFMITNVTTGDVCNIILGDKNDPIKANEIITLDWAKNEYTRTKTNGSVVDFSKKVKGDLMFVTGRTFVERIDAAAVKKVGNTLQVHLDPGVRTVRTSDIGKTIMYRNLVNNNVYGADGAGGKIAGVNASSNYFILDSNATGNANNNVLITISQMDDIRLAISSSANLDASWGLQPRYL